MKKETINRIAENMEKGVEIKTRIKGYWYMARYDSERDRVELEPVGSGSFARSDIDAMSYQYTHGGKIFRRAVQAAWAIENLLREKWAGEEPIQEEQEER